MFGRSARHGCIQYERMADFQGLAERSEIRYAGIGHDLLLTVIFDLTIAIELGLVLAVVLFVKRMSESSQISIFNEEVEEAEYVEGND